MSKFYRTAIIMNRKTFTALCMAGIFTAAGATEILEPLLSGKKRQNHIFSTNIISYTCFTKKGLSFEAM